MEKQTPYSHLPTRNTVVFRERLRIRSHVQTRKYHIDSTGFFPLKKKKKHKK